MLDTAPGVTRVELVIGGMTCAGCAAGVQARLNKLDGVTASVNLATERAHVTAPAHLSAADLISVIEAAGYSAEPAAPARDDNPGTAEAAAVRSLRRRLTLALVFFVPLTDLSMMLSIFPGTRFPGWQPLLVALAAPVATWAAWPFHQAALKQVRHLSAAMDTLVSLGILAACGWSVYAMFVLDRTRAGRGGLQAVLHGSAGGIYLEVAASVTTFLLAGRLYEARARRSAGEAVRTLAAAGARDVCVLGPDGTEHWIPAGLLRAGQRFVVRPGERIAADGEVESGQSAVDRSMMTGESVPVDAAPGAPVTGGTIALTGRLVVRADKVGADTQLAHLIRMVEQAQAGQAGVQRLADRVCAVFVPSVLACAVLTLAGWLVAGRPAGHAVSAALAVLIIACPCALGLATPAALVAASGRGAQLGIFIKGYQALESSRAIDTVVLDKTGTVTTAQMSVTAVHLVPGTARAGLLRYAASVEQASEHAVAAAVVALARAESAPLTPPGGFTALPGLGARGTVDGREVTVGRATLFPEVPAAVAAWCGDQERSGRTTVLVSWDGEIRGALAVTDTVKPSAPAAVARLRALGLRPVLLTGDNAATAQAVAAAAGLGEVLSEALPAAKARVIAELQAAGRSVAMVGDGVNDGPALAAARLGLAMGSGTDVAICAADMILLRDDLTAVPDAIALARATFRTIRRNLAWAFCYNVAAIPLAALGYLNPLVAAAAMTLSSVFVVWNSLRLRRFRSRALHTQGGPPMGYRLRMSAEIHDWLIGLRDSDPPAALLAGQALAALAEQGGGLGPPLVISAPDRPRPEELLEALDLRYRDLLESLTVMRRRVAEAATQRRDIERQLAGLRSPDAGLRQRLAGLVEAEEQLTAASQREQMRADAFRTRKEVLKARYTAARAAYLVEEASGQDAGEPAGEAAARLRDVTGEMERELGLQAPDGDLLDLRPGAPGDSDIRILFAVEPPGTALLLAVLEGRDAVRDHYREAVSLAAGVLRRVRAGQAPEAVTHAYGGTRSFLEEFFPGRADEVSRAAPALVAANRPRPLAEQRTRLGLTQAQVARRMGVRRDRVAAIERAEPGATQLRTLAAYVEALGGRLDIVADFGAERILLR